MSSGFMSVLSLEFWASCLVTVLRLEYHSYLLGGSWLHVLGLGCRCRETGGHQHRGGCRSRGSELGMVSRKSAQVGQIRPGSREVGLGCWGSFGPAGIHLSRPVRDRSRPAGSLPGWAAGVESGPAGFHQSRPSWQTRVGRRGRCGPAGFHQCRPSRDPAEVGRGGDVGPPGTLMRVDEVGRQHGCQPSRFFSMSGCGQFHQADFHPSRPSEMLPSFSISWQLLFASIFT